jgi:hypothetical protein
MGRFSASTPGTFGVALTRAFLTRTAVLKDKSGSTIEAIAATALSIVVIGMIAAGSVADMTALSVSSSNSERIQYINSLVAKPELVPGWKTATGAALATPATLPSSTVVNTYTWSTDTTTGTQYYAAMPRSGNTTSGASCASRTVNDAAKCVYASAFKADDVRQAMPPAPAGLAVISLASPIPAGTIIASAPAPVVASATTPPTKTLWRFYVSAATVGANGTLRLQQGGTRLGADVPLSTTADGYFGTLTVTAGTAASPAPPIVLYSPDRTVAATKVIIYRTAL